MRTVIDVPKEDIEKLDRVSRSKRCSRAALIRQAIAEYVRAKAVPPAEAAFGLWKQKQKDGITYQNELRDEWAQR